MKPRTDRLALHEAFSATQIRNVKEIYYQYEDELEAPAFEEPASEAPSSSPSAPASVVAAPVAAPSGPVASIEDVPIKAVGILLVVIAQKLQERVDEILLSKTIKDLVGGKSTLQNEIIGDLQQEFAPAPEKGKEFLLEELGAALGTLRVQRTYMTARCARRSCRFRFESKNDEITSCLLSD